MGVKALAVVLATVFFAVAAGCERNETTEAVITPDAPENARIVNALSHTGRSDDDRSDDVARKPANVLSFIGLDEGARVFEMEAGGGYYTELFANLVGTGGTVIAQSPASFDAFLGGALEARVNGRLGNVRISKSNFDQLDAADASVDVVTWILGPHELYFTPSTGESLGEPSAVYEEIVRILKPGGAFFVLDHAAASGSPQSTGGTTHRIDPEIVKTLAADAGLLFAGESDVLRNPDDDYELIVFDPSIRRKTDRFLFKFTKPAG